MHRRPFRASLSLLLVFALLSMVGPRAAMGHAYGSDGHAASDADASWRHANDV